jgi:phosphoglycolate phosphatase
MHYKAVIFDLDGTLVDTLADLSEAINFALEKFAQPARTVDDCRVMIGSGVRNFVKRALTEDKQHLVDDILVEMRAFYTQNCLNKARLYDGIAQLVAQLTSRGIALAVCTNKDQGDARRIIDHFFGGSVFDPVVGARQGCPIKPHRQATAPIVDSFGLDPREIVFVGDSDIDIATAENAQIPFIGVSWGFRTAEELRAAGGKIIIDFPEELVKLIS